MRIEDVISRIGPLDGDAMKAARERQNSLTKPRGSLGVMEELSIRIAGITGKGCPEINDKAIITMAGDHGVTEEGISAYPSEVTLQMVLNFLGGGAGVNVLARHVGARVTVVDMGVAADIKPHPELVAKKVAYGTKNMVKGPAMKRGEAEKSIEAGIDVFEDELKKGLDIVGTGDMGIGNTTSSSAIAAVITGKGASSVTGRGTGINDSAFESKIKTIEGALEVNNPDPSDPLDVLTKVGGLEIGGLAGVILAGAANRVPVVIDGFISGAAALIATGFAPNVREHLIASHKSMEAGHGIVLEYMGLSPLLDLNLRLGEGTGAALGISMAEASLKILGEMATFEDAGVSNKK